MRLSIIKSLFLMNLLYINPAKTNLQRIKAQKNGKNLQTKMFRTFLLGQIFLIVFLSIFLGINSFGNQANKYISNTIFILAFSILTIIQPFFTVFYEDKVTEHLSPFPISEKEIFSSKLFTLLSQSIGVLLSFIIINIISNIQFSEFNILASIVIIIYSLALFGLVVSLVILLFSSLIKTKLFIKHKKIFNTIIQIIAFSFFFFLYGISTVLTRVPIKAKDYEGDFLFNIVANPLSLESLTKILVMIILFITIIILLNNFVVKTYFEDLIKINSDENKKLVKKHKKEKFNIAKIYKKITLKTFANGTLITQMILGPLVIPMIFLPIFIYLSSNPYFQQGLTVLPTVIIISVILAISMYGNGSFSFLAVSIDYKNYEFLKTLPTNLRQYLLTKYFLAISLQMLPAMLVYCLIITVLGGDLMFFVVGFLTFIITSFIYSTHYFIRDVENPFTGWSNITQLMSRGNTGIKQWLIFFGAILASTLSITLTVIYTIFLSNLWWLLTTIYLIIIITLFITTFKRFIKVINNQC